jgi:hypothetical protein
MQLPSKKMLLVFASLLLAYLAASYWVNSYLVPRQYQEFHAAQLRGTIYRRTSGKMNASLLLNNDKQTYTFFPVDSLGYPQNGSFAQVAASGDSLYKDGSSDTLYVVAKGHRYVFVGAKPR